MIDHKIDEQFLQELIDLYYTPLLVQDTVEKTYLRLGQQDVLAYILKAIQADLNITPIRGATN